MLFTENARSDKEKGRGREEKGERKRYNIDKERLNNKKIVHMRKRQKRTI